MYCYVNTATAGKCEGRLMRDAMPDDAIRVCSMIDSYQNNGGNKMSEDVFEKVSATKYRPDIIERTKRRSPAGDAGR